MYSLVFGSDLQQFKLKDDFCLTPPPFCFLLLIPAAENFVFHHATASSLKSHIQEEKNIKQGPCKQTRMQIVTFFLSDSVTALLSVLKISSSYYDDLVSVLRHFKTL